MRIGDVTSDDLVQLITLFLSLIGAIVWIYWGVKVHRLGYAIAPITYLLHRALFYVVITIWQIPSAVVAVWAAAIGLHSVLTLIMAAIVMIVFTRQRRINS